MSQGVSDQRPPHRRLALISAAGDPTGAAPTDSPGGQQIHVGELARTLAARGHAVDVITRGATCDRPEHDQQGGVRWIRLPAGPVGHLTPHELYRHLPEFLWALHRFHEGDGSVYDVLHTHDWPSGWVGLRLSRTWQIPQVHTFHTVGHAEYLAAGRMPSGGARRLAVERDLMVGCQRLIAQSPRSLAQLRQHYPGRRPVSVVPGGIDRRRFCPGDRQAARKALVLPADRLVIAFVGDLTFRKGLATLLPAFAVLTNRWPVHLVIAGPCDDPDGQARTRQLVLECGLQERITFLGCVPHAELQRVYQAADLSVVPSLYEPFSLVALEAMACGLPVVASRIGGLPYEVTDGDTGLLVPAGNAEALIDACDRLLASPNLRRQLGRQAHDRAADHFDWHRIAERLESLYQGMTTAAVPSR